MAPRHEEVTDEQWGFVESHIPKKRRRKDGRGRPRRGDREHLQEQGEIDLSECHVDASFIGANKGGSKLVKRAVAKAPRSWQWQTLMVFQSPSTYEVLRRLRSPLHMKLSNKACLPMFQNDSLQIALMTVRDSLEHSLQRVSNSSHRIGTGTFRKPAVTGIR